MKNEFQENDRGDNRNCKTRKLPAKAHYPKEEPDTNFIRLVIIEGYED